MFPNLSMWLKQKWNREVRSNESNNGRKLHLTKNERSSVVVVLWPKMTHNGQKVDECGKKDGVVVV